MARARSPCSCPIRCRCGHSRRRTRGCCSRHESRLACTATASVMLGIATSLRICTTSSASGWRSRSLRMISGGSRCTVRGAWVCTAVPQETLSEEQQREVIDARRRYARELRRRQRAATHAARGRLAPMTSSDPQPAEVRRAHPSELAAGRERSLSTAARTDPLIGRSGPPRAKKSA